MSYKTSNRKIELKGTPIYFISNKEVYSGLYIHESSSFEYAFFLLVFLAYIYIWSILAQSKLRHVNIIVQVCTCSRNVG